jgi:hypothetical protein
MSGKRVRIFPHLIAVLHVPAAVAVGIAADETAPIGYAGAVFELGTDPIVVAAAVAIGILSFRWWHVVAAGLVADLAIHLYVLAVNDLATGSLFVFLARASGLLTIASGVNLLRLAVQALSARKPAI